MKTLIFLIGFLAVLDLCIIPFLLLYIKKTGGFHYLLTNFHKVVFLVLIFATGLMFFGNTTQNLLIELVFCASLLFVFNLTFEINSYLLTTFDPSKYSLEGMTDEGKRMMECVFDNMRSQNQRTFAERFGEMSHNFIQNIMQDLNVVVMIVTNNVAMKESYNELHKIMGNDTKFSTMSIKDLFFMVKSRILVDIVALVFVAFLLMV